MTVSIYMSVISGWLDELKTTPHVNHSVYLKQGHLTIYAAPYFLPPKYFVCSINRSDARLGFTVSKWNTIEKRLRKLLKEKP